MASKIRIAQTDRHPPWLSLTNVAPSILRERQVFELIVSGKSNKAVAQLLCSTARTIKANGLG